MPHLLIFLISISFAELNHLCYLQLITLNTTSVMRALSVSPIKVKLQIIICKTIMNDVQQRGGLMITVEAVVHTTNQDIKLKKKK